jgi:hypothetical protein
MKRDRALFGATLCNQTPATYKRYLNDLIDTFVQRFVLETEVKAESAHHPA